MLDIIQAFNFEWHSPVVLVQKEKQYLQVCVWIQGVEQDSNTHVFPLPYKESVFDAIGEAITTYFTNLDLMSGFWQMELDEGSREKAAFIPQSGVLRVKKNAAWVTQFSNFSFSDINGKCSLS